LNNEKKYIYYYNIIISIFLFKWLVLGENSMKIDNLIFFGMSKKEAIAIAEEMEKMASDIKNSDLFLHNHEENIFQDIADALCGEMRHVKDFGIHIPINKIISLAKKKFGLRYIFFYWRRKFYLQQIILNIVADEKGS